MSTISHNRISLTLTPAQLTAIMAAGNAVITNTPGAVGLTPKERQTMPKINVSNKAFVEDAIAIFTSNPSLFPSYVNLANMTTDFALFQQLDAIVIFFRQILERLEDMHMLAGSEAFMTGLMAYKLIGNAAEAGLPGADTIYEQLRARFEGQGSTGPSGSTTPEAETEAPEDSEA